MDVCPIRYSVGTAGRIDQHSYDRIRKTILRYVLDGPFSYNSYERGGYVQYSGYSLASCCHGRGHPSRAGADKYELVERPAPDCGHDSGGGVSTSPVAKATS